MDSEQKNEYYLLIQAVENSSIAAQTAASAAESAAASAAALLVTAIPVLATIVNLNSSSTNVTGPTVTASNTNLLIANKMRTGVIISNTGTYPVKVLFGTNASVSNYSITINSQAFFQLNNYTGNIDAVCAPTLSTSLEVTEFVQ